MQNRYLITTSIISALLHAFLFYYLFSQKPKNIKSKNVYNVSYVKNFNKEQYVSTFTKDSKVEVNTNLKSDKNTIVEKEQIKKGDNGNLPKTIIQKPKPAIKQTQQQKPIKKEVAEKEKAFSKNIEKPTNKKVNAKPKKLDLSPAINTLKDLASEQKVENNKNKFNKSFNVEPFSREEGANVVISGFASGSSDHLPTIRDGDITLLNAKADKFAVFVRRVAVRVFQILKQSGWERLTASQVRKINTWTKVIGAINLKGELVELKLVTTSGNVYFDQVVKDSVGNGITDPNPPASAVAIDGNIRFIFLAKSWSQTGGGGGNQRFFERRWLGLKTGLE